MGLLLKKDEKINRVLADMPDDYTMEMFVLRFKELYNKDWLKLEKAYTDHLRKSKPGKIQPMPNPEQYLKNAVNVWKNKKKQI